MGDDPKMLTIMVVPDGGRETRTFRIPYAHLRLVGLGGLVLLLVLGGMVGSWWYLAARAQQATQLEEEVRAFAEDRARMEGLAATLDEVERAYEHLRSLFGASAPGRAGEVWLPPAAGRTPATRSVGGPDDALPTSWPLAERGFLTQALLEGGGRDHPGIDIAIPTGSYIRSAGSGAVSEVGEDPVYGLYLIVDHGNGYRTLYAHASALKVAMGDPVRRNEVIGLTGSTGRSTAPHLHFEIQLDGNPVDPLTLVRQP